VKGQLEAEVAAGRLAKTLSVDVEELEAMEGAAKRFGGTAEGMDASLKGLNSRLAMIAIHGPRSKMALQIFAGMGISEVALKGKDATQVMGLLAEKMEHLSGAKAMALGERLGLDEGTVRMLQSGKENVAQLTAEIRKNVASKEQVEAAEKFEQSMLKLQGGLAATGRQILTAVMPALLSMSAGLAKVSAWIRDHGEVVKAVLIGVAAGFALVGANALRAGLMAAKAWIIGLGPLGIVIAAVAALGAVIAWVYLEFKKWAAGGESVLSGFFNYFKGIWDGIKGTVMTVFTTLKDIVMTWFHIFGDEWDLVVGIFTGNGEKIRAAFKKLCDDIGHFFSQAALLMVYGLLRAFFIIKHAAARMWDDMKRPAGAFIQWLEDKIYRIAKFFGMGDKAIKLFQEVNGAIKSSGALMLNAHKGPELAYAGHAGMALRPSVSNSRSTSTSTRETHIGAIHIETKATDAKGIAAELPGAIKSHGLVDQADGGF